MTRFKDRTGKRYGRLLVIELWGRDKNQVFKWRCKCDCGNETIIYGQALHCGATTSCGCYHREFHTTHGDSYTRLYRIHKGMLERCNTHTMHDIRKHKNYRDYGIKVCSKWHNYETFKKWALRNGYTDNKTIDRKDVNKDYTPQNCRWVTQVIQARNKRKIANKSSKYLGVSLRKNRKTKKWNAHVRHDNTMYSQSFLTEVEAAKARDAYILEHNLKGFNLNFP